MCALKKEDGAAEVTWVNPSEVSPINTFSCSLSKSTSVFLLLFLIIISIIILFKSFLEVFSCFIPKMAKVLFYFMTCLLDLVLNKQREIRNS